MSFISQGFPGATRRGCAGRARASRSVSDRRVSGAFCRPDASRRPRRVAPRGRGCRGRPSRLDVAGVHGAAGRGRQRGHPLRDQVVEARHLVAGRLGRHAPRRGRHRGGLRARPLVRRLHDEPAARGPDRRQGLGRLRVRRASRSTPSTAGPPGCWCRTSTSGRAPSGCAACEVLDEDEPGFWERYGYHDYGDPWREQRYAGD